MPRGAASRHPPPARTAHHLPPSFRPPSTRDQVTHSAPSTTTRLPVAVPSPAHHPQFDHLHTTHHPVKPPRGYYDNAEMKVAEARREYYFNASFSTGRYPASVPHRSVTNSNCFFSFDIVIVSRLFIKMESFFFLSSSSSSSLSLFPTPLLVQLTNEMKYDQEQKI